jgi:SAM-dependent methyltransferase
MVSIKSFFRDYVAPSSERLRNTWITKKLLSIPKDKSILDVGAGEMPYKRYCSHLRYKSQDFGKYSGEGDKRGIQTGKYDTKSVDIISDITDIPVRTNAFDYILCTEVFEHVPNPLSALKEINRITKRGGSLILTAPFASLAHFNPYYFYSGFSEQFYRINLPKFGYKIKEIYMYGNYFDWLAVEFLRTPYIIFGYNKFIFIFSLPIMLIASPLYLLLRLSSNIFPKSKDTLAFGICVIAIKKGRNI